MKTHLQIAPGSTRNSVLVWSEAAGSAISTIDRSADHGLDLSRVDVGIGFGIMQGAP